jgi:hypothetical protein
MGLPLSYCETNQHRRSESDTLLTDWSKRTQAPDLMLAGTRESFIREDLR